jgi:hypothetical protein
VSARPPVRGCCALKPVSITALPKARAALTLQIYRRDLKVGELQIRRGPFILVRTQVEGDELPIVGESIEFMSKVALQTDSPYVSRAMYRNMNGGEISGWDLIYFIANQSNVTFARLRIVYFLCEDDELGECQRRDREQYKRSLSATVGILG